MSGINSINQTHIFIVILIVLLSVMPLVSQAQEPSTASFLAEKDNKKPSYVAKLVNGHRYLVLDGKTYSDDELMSMAASGANSVIAVPSLEEFKPSFFKAYLDSEKFKSGMYARMPEKVKLSRLERSWTQINENLVSGNIKGIPDDIERICPEFISVVLANGEGFDNKSIQYFTMLLNIQQSKKYIAEGEEYIAEGEEIIKQLKIIQNISNSITKTLGEKQLGSE